MLDVSWGCATILCWKWRWQLNGSGETTMSTGWIFKTQKPRPNSGKVHPRYRRGNPRVNTTVARVDSETEGGLGSSVLYRHRMISQGYMQLASGKWIKPKSTPPTKLDIRAYYAAGFELPPVVDAMRDRIEERLKTVFWQSDRQRGFDHWKHIICHKDVYQIIICYFNGAKALFVELDWLYYTLRESCVYDVANAREIFRRKRWTRISWVEMRKYPASPQQQPPPS